MAVPLKEIEKPRPFELAGASVAGLGGWNGLLFVAVLFGGDRGQCAEEAVNLIVDAGAEEHCCGRAGGSVVSEGQGPDAVNEDEGIVWVTHEANEFLGESVEGGDPSARGIANGNGVAELAEVARSPNDAPGRVHPVAVLEATLEFTRGAENVDEAKTGAANGIVASCILLGVGDEKATTDVLYVEGREATGNILVLEGTFVRTPARGTVGNVVLVRGVFTELHALEVCVVNFDGGVAEIGDVEESLALDFAGGHPFVDGAVRRAVIGVVDLQNSVRRRRTAAGEKVYGRIPAGDGSIFGGEDEDSGSASGVAFIEEEISRAAIVYDAGGS